MPSMTEDTLTREQLLRARGADALSSEPPADAATPPAEETGSPRPPCLQCGKPLPPRCTKFCTKLCGRRHRAARRGPDESPAPGPGVVTLVAQLLDGTIVDSVEIHVDGARLVVRSAGR